MNVYWRFILGSIWCSKLWDLIVACNPSSAHNQQCRRFRNTQSVNSENVRGDNDNSIYFYERSICIRSYYKTAMATVSTINLVGCCTSRLFNDWLQGLSSVLVRRCPVLGLASFKQGSRNLFALLDPFLLVLLSIVQKFQVGYSKHATSI